MELNRTDCQYVDIEVSATLRDGAPAPLTGVDVAMLAKRRTPDTTTVWTAATYNDGVATVLLAGPQAAAVPDSLVVPDGGGDLWIRVIDAPEVDSAHVARISVV